MKLKVTSKLKKHSNARTSSPSPQTAASIDEPTQSVECGLLKMYDVRQNLPTERRISYNMIDTQDAATEYLCCSDQLNKIPPSPPAKWPQRPILLRPSPESRMKIRGVRYSSSKEYLPMHVSGYCEGCTLPINNGYEETGKCLVIDFETALFIGTLLLRVKDIDPPSLNEVHSSASSILAAEESHNENHYFNKRKRTFQATIKGRFKQPGIPISECITGQTFYRPAGYLPPRLIMKGALSIISRLAPQVEIRLEGDRPRFFSPLVSTAQTVLVSNPSTTSKMTESIEHNISEPNASDQSSIMQSLTECDAAQSSGMSTLPTDNSSTSSRIKRRKRAFDKVFSFNLKTPTFNTDREYTFEFFQHLTTFNDFCLNFVEPIGKHPLHGMLNGQPLKFMAAHKTLDEVGEDTLKWLWCFDLWHESLYSDALEALEE